MTIAFPNRGHSGPSAPNTLAPSSAPLLSSEVLLDVVDEEPNYWTEGTVRSTMQKV